jgi:hypothetical protein
MREHETILEKIGDRLMAGAELPGDDMARLKSLQYLDGKRPVHQAACAEGRDCTESRWGGRGESPPRPRGPDRHRGWRAPRRLGRNTLAWLPPSTSASATNRARPISAAAIWAATLARPRFCCRETLTCRTLPVWSLGHTAKPSSEFRAKPRMFCLAKHSNQLYRSSRAGRNHFPSLL